MAANRILLETRQCAEVMISWSWRDSVPADPSVGWGRLMLVSRSRTMSTIDFEAKLFNIGAWILLRLPENPSAKLPSRGMTMAEGTINGVRFQAALEPDGKRSHWLRVDTAMLEA